MKKFEIDGSIDCETFRELLIEIFKDQGRPIAEDELQKLVEDTDCNHDGRI